jgi:hypothetical protein
MIFQVVQTPNGGVNLSHQFIKVSSVGLRWRMKAREEGKICLNGTKKGVALFDSYPKKENQGLIKILSKRHEPIQSTPVSSKGGVSSSEDDSSA